MIDVLIIGAGCAGLTAAIYAAREGKKVLVLEGESVGGQIAFSPRVENYPAIKEITGLEFADALSEQAFQFGAELDLARAEKIVKEKGGFTVVTDSGELSAKSVIIAAGAKHRPLGLPRESELIGNGISYCATCDGAFYAGKRVAVAGGGSAALQSAITLSGMCERVYLIHRRKEFRAETALVNRAMGIENIETRLGYNVSALLGDDKLTGVSIADAVTGAEARLDIDCLFVCVGQTPDNASFSDLVALDDAGYILAGESCVTSCPGIFAAGDCRAKKVRQLTTAAADGAVAGLAACEYSQR